MGVGMSDKYTETILALNNRLCEAERQLAGVVELLREYRASDRHKEFDHNYQKDVDKCSMCQFHNKVDQALANLPKALKEQSP